MNDLASMFKSHGFLVVIGALLMHVLITVLIKSSIKFKFKYPGNGPKDERSHKKRFASTPSESKDGLQ